MNATRPPNTSPTSPSQSARPPLERKTASVSPRQSPPDAASSDSPSKDDESATTPQAGGSPDEETLRKLREEMNAKLAYSQQRARLSQSRSSSSGTLSARRVSPIKEEPSNVMSPSLEASFSSPLPTGQTTSTESTESTKTVRASVPPTPSQTLRTPSYPFPYVPGTPKTWSSSFHKPFTALSPTVQETKDQTASGTSSPAASVSTFMPMVSPSKEDPQYPSPVLYELILKLNTSEPGLEGWWAGLSRIMYESYGAERMALALPADSNDIGNVPWGQKATFNMNGRPATNPSLQRFEFPTRPKEQRQTAAPLRNVYDDIDPGSTPSSSRGRPKIQARHSYAEYERKGDRVSSKSPTTTQRPHISRATSYAPHAITFIEEEFDGRAERGLPKAFPFSQPLEREHSKGASFLDPEFSSSGGSEQPIGPYHRVLPMLRALNFEDHALLDDAGVNRIIERGKVVTLTRDYSAEGARRESIAPHQSPGSKASAGKQPPTQGKHTIAKPSDAQSIAGKRLGLVTDYFNRMKTQPPYEEYEQFPSSPWAQSPAPSPAIQADPEVNPFFAGNGGVDEATFEPSESSQDYSQYQNVEAIGVDKASTIIHVPLVHPVLSQVLPPRMSSHRASNTPTTGRPSSKLSVNTEETSPSDISPRRAPLAILSFLSPIVPYPPNLIQSLKLLAPHMATSFSMAQQYSNVHRQAAESLFRRTSGHRFASLGDTGTLEGLMDADIDTNNSTTGSVTSPSDYSGRSRPSPGGSLVGTPGWDSPALVFPRRQSVGSTPGVSGPEMIDSYFDAKKRSPMPRTESINQLTPSQRATGRESPTADTRPVSRRGQGSEENKPTKTEQRPSRDRTSGSGQREVSPTWLGRTSSPKTKTVSTQLPEGHHHKQHTLLHSYGADFAFTFQSLPSAATPSARTPGHGPASGHHIQGEEAMPPPSERLLRTIIDSLPVQIFTAAPSTGELTWVSSKFLVYRGQDPQHVLVEPWHAIHPEDREHYMEQWRKSLSTGQPFSHKVRLQRFDNEYRWFYVRATPLKDRRQKIVHWTGTNMDIHEQHIAESHAARQQETAASEAKYRTLANSSPQIVFAVNRTKGIIFCNTQWLTYSGQTETQALGIGFMEHVHPDDLAKCRLPTLNDDGTPADDVPTSVPPEVHRQDSSRSSSDDSSDTGRTVTSPGIQSPSTVALPQAKLSKLASQGILKVSKDADGRPSYSTEVRLRSKDGQYRWHLVRVLLSEPVRKDEIEEETWYGTCTDINDHKVLEQTLKDTMDAKSRFLSNMSHEIRTPLNGITGMVNFLIDSSLTAEQMEHVNIIRSSTEGLRDLINDILDLSKVEAGMVSLQMEWMHVRSLIEEVNDLTSSLAIDKGLELNYLVAKDVPSMVKGDRFRIRQVLLNVVGNAIKFTQTGEVFVKCHVDEAANRSPKPDETMLKFEVIDTGPGFSNEEAQYLFKRFSQIDSSSTKAHSGTGLGLAISMQLVELHGGTMWANSEPNEGSTFYFTAKFNVPSMKDRPSIPGTPGIFEFHPPAIKPVELEPSKEPLKSASPFQPERVGKDNDSPSTSAPSPLQQQSSAASSGSSDPSIHSSRTSVSNLSTVSSMPSEPIFKPASPPITLELPTLPREDSTPSQTSSAATLRSTETTATVVPLSATPSPRSRSPFQPTMYSILVVCPLEHAREATASHIDLTIPKSSPHHITPRASFKDCQPMFDGDDPVTFTHVVLILRDVREIISFMDRIFKSPSYPGASIIIITDLAQRRDIMTKAPSYDYESLQNEQRLRFIFKPSKPSKFAVIFDPQKERELSSDRNQNSAQAVAVSQKQVFDEMKKQLGNKGIRVLLVEDNKTNQMVLLKFFNRVAITVESALDGVQCTDKVFDKPYGYYSVILCDLHMPNKDGYQTCKDIRAWETAQKQPHMPIIALSANVLGDVYAKCVEAGFNSYVTKPVDFKELSNVLVRFLDPPEGKKGKEPEFMKKGSGGSQRRR